MYVRLEKFTKYPAGQIVKYKLNKKKKKKEKKKKKKEKISIYIYIYIYIFICTANFQLDEFFTVYSKNNM